MTGVWLGVLFAALAGLAAVLGGALVFLRRNWSQRGLQATLAFSGGFMLGAALLGMAPEGLHLLPKWGPYLLLAGYLTVHFLEHVVGGHYHFAGDDHGGRGLVSTTVTGATLFAMSVHTFFDGVAIGSAFVVSRSMGLVVFLAVLMHKVAEGFTVSTVALASGARHSRAFGASTLIGLGTVLGSLVLGVAEPYAAFAVPISAGALVHVAASDLIPEVNEGQRWPITVTVVAGGLTFLVLSILAGPHLHR